jgi:RecB family exonuclease
VEKEQLLESLVETVRGITELRDGWEPIAFEQVFGLEGEPPLELKIDGRKVRLHGVIDRVDRDERGQLRVLDYKTGSSGLNPRDLIDGRRLQLPLYALAARDALGIGEPVEGLYWAILAGNPGGLRLSRFKHEIGERVYLGPAGAYQLAREYVAQTLAGVRTGAFRPAPPRGGCPSYCPAAAWCWRYVPTAW